MFLAFKFVIIATLIQDKLIITYTLVNNYYVCIITWMIINILGMIMTIVC